ncbi:MAG: ATP-binding cassette domain-containing protein, partial [Woeseiaceae bacterium]
METLIHARNIEKSVPQGENRLYLLRQITLDVPQGDFVTFMGPSGAGKSTLMSILGLLDSDWAGEYELAGSAVHSLPHKKR